MTASVLDSSAVLAFLKSERGADAVEARREEAIISAVNAVEVISTLTDRGLSSAQAMAEVMAMALPIVPLDEDLAFRTGALRALTRKHGLSLGDRACLALAQREGLPVLTADRAWAALDLGVEVVLIR